MVEDRLTQEQIGEILQLFVDAGLPAAFEEDEDEGEEGAEEGDVGMEEEHQEEDEEDRQEER